MKKILIFITCIMAGMGTSYAQITPPRKSLHAMEKCFFTNSR